MTIRRVALIFDHRARPETTGVYCRRALGRLVETEHVLPDELATLSRTDFDLYLRIDDGLDYSLPRDLRPAAFWAIDTHLDFDGRLDKSWDVDFVFAAQRDGAERLRRAGLNAAWLPLACDPEVHRKRDVPKRFDVAFVGNVFPGPRGELLRLLRRRYSDCFVGNRYFDDMAETYSAARIVFNRSLRNDVNMRVFEAAACGSMLLTDDLAADGQDELFRPGVHLETYRDADELLDKVAFYLARDEARERIAAAGAAEAHARHTYRHRMEGLLATVEAGSSRATVAPAFRAATPNPSPEPIKASDPSYFEHARPELLELIPSSARRVLDLGCGAGRLGEALKARRGGEVEVVGVERNEAAARLAEARLDRVLVADLERFEPDWPDRTFHAIVCGDVLEHLKEPERLLRRAREWLKPGGRIVASIPNVRHHGVVAALLEGNWTYESAGLLDRDHARFYTRREIEKLFFRAGFAVERLAIVPGPGYREWLDLGRPGSIRVGRLSVGGLDPADAEEFYAYQYLVVAFPEPAPDRGLTSIVVLTHNELGYTRECLDSVRLRTDEPHELIVVDNGSTDGTVEYLRGLPDARLIENAENRGFAAAANQALAIASGRQVVLLNNDTVVTVGWLRRMLEALERDPTIGLAGPCSNRVAGDQQVPVSYDDLACLDGFAWDWGKPRRGEIEETERLIGFCLMIRRETLDQIGGLDERFGIGCYEDDDYCLRARRAGWRAVIVRDAFVHHYGSRTFIGAGIDLGAVLRENERKFRRKWAVDEPRAIVRGGAEPEPALIPAAATPRLEYALNASPSAGLLLRRKRPRLSLCMIVRDNAGTIRPCLESVRPWVDEMVIVDTGSVDDTPDIVREYDARLFRFPWRDDFSAARNESLKHAEGEWLFWMDSDDTIEPESGRGLRELALGRHDPATLGYVVAVRCPGPGEDGEFDVTVVDHVKLIRNRPDLRFDGRIHEQLLPAIRRAGGEVAWTDLYVVHSGSDHTPEGRERKIRRDLRLLDLELAERPEHPFTLFNLGMTHADRERFEEAIEFLERSIRASGPGESHLRKAYALLLHAQSRLGRRDEARETLRDGRRLFPEDAELLFRQGVLLHELGHLEESARAYRTLLGGSEERHFSSLDRGITGFKARQNLAAVLTEAGDLDAAEAQWREIVREQPRYRIGWRGLGDVLLRRGNARGLRELIDRLAAEPGLEAEALALSAKLAAAVGDVRAGRVAFEAAIAARPDDVEIRHDYCRLLFEREDPTEAEAALLDLIRLRPDDAAAHHNLGTIRLREGRLREAIEAYRESLKHRPNHAPTHSRLGVALKESGRIREAAAAWEEASRLDPADAEARVELERIGGRGAAAVVSPSSRRSPS